MSRSELGEFLRARRAQLNPRQVGLREGSRRRTPGLRREEVASIAGISIDYLVRLEQGRETNPSVSVLSALADALLLSEEEQRHLHTLAAVAHSPGPCGTADGPSPQVATTVLELLGRFSGAPACVVGPYCDVLAWNTVWERLAAPLGVLDRTPPNLARFTFLDPAARAIVADWHPVADGYVAQLRTAAIYWRNDQRIARLVEDLRRSPEFARRWDAHPVVEDLRGTRSLRHPFGTLHVAFEAMLTADDGQRVIWWLAADEPTAALFAQLAADDRRTSAAPHRTP